MDALPPLSAHAYIPNHATPGYSTAPHHPAPAPGRAAGREDDRVEVSDRALRADAAAPHPGDRHSPDTPIRPELVTSVREAMRAGTYFTEEKLNTAAARLARDLDLLA